MMHVLIRQAKVYDPQSPFHNQVVDIFIEDGVIRNIGHYPDTLADTVTVIEGNELWVSPGWVDVFADYREPGFEYKETIATGLTAAAAGGFTRVLITPNTQPVLDQKSAVQYVLQRARGHVTTLHPLGAVSRQTEGKELAEMLDMHHFGAIAFTDGWKPVQQASLMLKALEYVKAFDGTIVQLPAEMPLSSGGLMHEGIVSTRLGIPGIPDLAETLMIHRDLELLRYTGSKIHFTGISATGSVAMIRAAKAEGLQVTCSVTPYHLALTDEALTSYSSLYKVMPPLRTEADRQALIEGLKDGTIDCITSHHRPQEWDAKAKEFEYASDGMNIQQIAWALTWDAVRDHIIPERLLDAIAIAPRRIFGLGKNTLEQGAHAEMTIFTPAGTTVLQPENNHSLSRNNPFEGKALNGKVIATIHNLSVHKNP